jgi:hypothetical protein
MACAVRTTSSTAIYRCIAVPAVSEVCRPSCSGRNRQEFPGFSMNRSIAGDDGELSPAAAIVTADSQK